jgi:CBS domain-containing protein
VLEVFSNSPYTQYPVVDQDRHLTGVINIDSIKNSLFLGDSGGLLIADDMKSRFEYAVDAGTTLQDAKNYMDEHQLGFVPIIGPDQKVIGCIDRRMYKKYVSTRLLEAGQDSG